MWAASALKLGGVYIFLLFMSMLSLNTIFSAQCGLVPDLVEPSQQGSASGIVAVHQLTGSITGFLVVLLTRMHDYHFIYIVYALMVLLTTVISCMTAKETPLPKHLSRPLTLSALASSFSLDCSQGYDFLWVFIGRTFYYIGVSVQAFILYFLRDQIPTSDGTRPSEGQLQVWIAEIAITAQVVAAAVAYPMGRLSDNAEVGRKKLVYAACTVMAAVYLLFMTAPFRPPNSLISPVTVILACCIIYGVGCGCFLSVDYAIALDTLPSKHRQIKSTETPLLMDSDETSATSTKEVALDAATDDAAAKDLGIWGVSAFLGSAIGPLLWGATLQLFGYTSTASEEESYGFGGYASIMIGGCIACTLAGICIAFVKGTR
ncbi:hypothetical protein FOZ60_001695 [Perkinsus olseni]|uniref:Uncharacterized protein n=1 Tax=Perkinsus olseni TaxID=32597 RepID=A0A7J6P0L3_PEROL|nr:hypothetical protein FOZ60_001695 [Perkinsus olseni]